MTLQVTDSANAMSTASATLTVVAANGPPVAVDDTVPIGLNTPSFTLAAPGVLANDTDPENHPLTAYLVTQPQSGTVNLAGNGSFVYTRTVPGVPGDSFVYRVTDGFGGWAMATVWFQSGNSPVITSPDSYRVVAGVAWTESDSMLGTSRAFGLLDNDVDPENDPVTAVLVGPPPPGMFSLSPNGHFTYTAPRTHPGGVVTFTYMATDTGSSIGVVETAEIWIRPLSDASMRVYASGGLPGLVTAQAAFGDVVMFSISVHNEGSCTVQGYDNTISVSLDNTSIGGTGMTAATPPPQPNHLWTVSVTIPSSLGFGIKRIRFEAVSSTQKVGTGFTEILAFQGPALWVGPYQGMYPTVHAAVAACPANGAIFTAGVPFESALPWGGGAAGVVIDKPLAVICQGLNELGTTAGRKILTVGPSHAGVVLWGVSLAWNPPHGPEQTPLSRFEAQSPLTLIDCEFLFNDSAGSGGLIEAKGPGTMLTAYWCEFIQHVSYNLSASEVKGGLIHVHSGASLMLEYCSFGGTAISGTQTVKGALVCFEGGSGSTCVITQCHIHNEFSPTFIPGVATVIGGAVCFDGGDITLSHSTFRATGSAPSVYGGCMAILGGANVLMDGVTIEGSILSATTALGAGMYIAGGSSVVMVHCGMSPYLPQSPPLAALSAGSGGNIAISEDSLLRVEHTQLRGLVADRGGSIFMDALPNGAPAGNAPRIRSGGGLVSLFNVRIAECQALVNGGAIWVGDSPSSRPHSALRLSHVTIEANSSPVNGGIHVARGSTHFSDCVVWNNSGPQYSQGIQGTVASILHTLAPIGAVHGHVAGTHGNITGIPYSGILPPRSFLTLQVDAGSGSASAAGLSGMRISTRMPADAGTSDIGFHHTGYRYIIGFREGVPPPIQTSPQGLLAANP